MMKIGIVTPAPPGSRKGNRITALRVARFLRELGQRVWIDTEYTGRRADALLALHARRSAAAIETFAGTHPGAPLVVMLTGTDVAPGARIDRRARRSLELATHLVVLQDAALDLLPAGLRPKARVIYQSAEPPRRRPRPLQRVFEVCVMGHLREVKDPFRTALAARRLPAESRVRVVHLGGALSPTLARRAREEMQRNPHYCWLGELPRWQAVRRLARSRLLVMTSKLEGGPSAVSEALVSGVPILATAIPAHGALLGGNYPGLFPVGDTAALVRLLDRAETDRAFYHRLKKACRRLAPRFQPDRERRAWRRLVEDFSR